MLSYVRFIQRFYIRHDFKVNDFTTQDYRTMCHLLKQKYLTHNEDIKIFKDIKLVDENNKLVGIYPASQARKKAYNMKKDITLINYTSDPVICKVVAFRNNLLNKFFDQIVYRHNQKLLSRANSTKQLKIALNLNQNQLKVKAKQIIQLSKKNIGVRVFMNCKQDTRDQCLEKLQFIKSQIQGKCIIDRDIRNYREDSDSTQSKNYTQTYSFTCKSRENQFMQMLKQSSEKAPEDAIHNFLKKYYKQDDVDMLDLKVTGQTISQDVNDIQTLTDKKVDKKTIDENARTKGKGVWKAQQPDANNIMQRQANARILNQRLKVLLGWTA